MVVAEPQIIICRSENRRSFACYGSLRDGYSEAQLGIEIIKGRKLSHKTWSPILVRFFFSPWSVTLFFTKDCKSVVSTAQCFLWHLLNVSETRSMVMIAKNAVNIRLISVPPRRFFFQKKNCVSKWWEEKISPEFHYQKVIKNRLLYDYRVTNKCLDFWEKRYGIREIIVVIYEVCLKCLACRGK